LSRGYAIAFSRVRNKRKPIMDSSVVHAGDHIEVQLKKGALACTVDGKTLGIESVWPEVKGDR
jgi:exonuclease VII large subunit